MSEAPESYDPGFSYLAMLLSTITYLDLGQRPTDGRGCMELGPVLNGDRAELAKAVQKSHIALSPGVQSITSQLSGQKWDDWMVKPVEQNQSRVLIFENPKGGTLVGFRGTQPH